AHRCVPAGASRVAARSATKDPAVARRSGAYGTDPCCLRQPAVANQAIEDDQRRRRLFRGGWRRRLIRKRKAAQRELLEELARYPQLSRRDESLSERPRAVETK